MAKSSIRRHHTLRLQSKWEKILQATDPNRNLSCVTFGRVFSKDPIDCGSPRCPICSGEKVLHPKLNRQKHRRAEREAFFIISERHETEALEC